MKAILLPITCLTVFLAGTVSTLGTENLQAPIPPRLTLTGQVLDPEDDPIDSATVSIYTARPREGNSPLCAFCYTDCAKSSATNAQGAFDLPDLDPTLVFRLLVIAPGYAPKFVEKARPELGPIVVSLEPRTWDRTPLEQKTRGRITNHVGEPIAGATVSVEGVQTEGRITWGGRAGLDPVAITDANGIFELQSTGPFLAANVSVTAREYAPMRMNGLESGKNWVLYMTRGVTVEGQVVNDRAPVADARVVLTGKDRTAGTWVGSFEIATDSEGRFTFLNIPADTDLFLTGKRDDFASIGHFPPRQLRTPEDGKRLDAGVTTIKPSLHIRGQVLLADGAPIPKGTRILLSSEKAWDAQEIKLPPNGQFEFPGLGREEYSLSIRINGYRLATANPNLNLDHGFNVEGLLSGNLDNWVIFMDKGPRYSRDFLRELAQKESRIRGGRLTRPTVIPEPYQANNRMTVPAANVR